LKYKIQIYNVVGKLVCY